MNTTIKIQNLKCGGCANTIINKISEIEHIKNVHVLVEENSVCFEYEQEQQLEVALAKLAAIGYPQEGEKNNVISKAKSFVSCATGKMTK